MWPWPWPWLWWLWGCRCGRHEPRPTDGGRRTCTPADGGAVRGGAVVGSAQGAAGVSSIDVRKLRALACASGAEGERGRWRGAGAAAVVRSSCGGGAAGVSGAEGERCGRVRGAAGASMLMVLRNARAAAAASSLSSAARSLIRRGGQLHHHGCPT